MKNKILAIILALCINATFVCVMLNATGGLVAIICGAIFAIASAILSYCVLNIK